MAVTNCGAYKPPYSRNPVDFSFKMNEEQHYISQFRNRLLVIVLVKISELSSELFLNEVEAAYKQTADKADFIILSIDSNDAPMLQMFNEFHEYSFSVGLAHCNVSKGQTELGVISLVPSIYLLNSNGRVVDMATGIIVSHNIVNSIARF